MFSSIRKAKILLPFFYERLGDYAALARMDLIQFRHEAVESIVAAAVGAGASLLRFIAVAAIVTEWETLNRILTACFGCPGLGPYHRRVPLPGAAVTDRLRALRQYWLTDFARSMGHPSIRPRPWITPIPRCNCCRPWTPRAELAQRLAEVPIGAPPSAMLR